MKPYVPWGPGENVHGVEDVPTYSGKGRGVGQALKMTKTSFGSGPSRGLRDITLNGGNLGPGTQGQRRWTTNVKIEKGSVTWGTSTKKKMRGNEGGTGLQGKKTIGKERTNARGGKSVGRAARKAQNGRSFFSLQGHNEN